MRTIIVCVCALTFSVPARANNPALRDQCMEARAIVYHAQTVADLYALATVASGAMHGAAEAIDTARSNRAAKRPGESFFEFAKRLLAESLDDECGGDT